MVDALLAKAEEIHVDAPILGKIFVENLDDLITEEDLTEVFTDYGVVENVSLPKDRGTGRNRGFGLVEMESEADEEAAIADLDGAEWYGQILKVTKAGPRLNRLFGS